MIVIRGGMTVIRGGMIVIRGEMIVIRGGMIVQRRLHEYDCAGVWRAAVFDRLQSSVSDRYY